MGFFVAQDMDLSHRAKFQLIINFFRVKAVSTGLKYLKDQTLKLWPANVKTLRFNIFSLLEAKYESLVLSLQ